MCALPQEGGALGKANLEEIDAARRDLHPREFF